MKKNKQYLVLFVVLVGIISLTGCSNSNSFSIDGMWETSGGTIITFQNGEASASLFGFNGGPNGNYELSQKTGSDGNYTLYGSHITGGTVEYSVKVESDDKIMMTLSSDSSFAPKTLTLVRK